MKNEMNQNRKEEGFETGSLDQFERKFKDDNRENDTLEEHQNSTRRANPQVQNSANNTKPSTAQNAKMNYNKR
ncbi:hypothetical protein GV828_02800 [Flavobacterium sp. NST-5]|uniref:Cold-shock protein n=1 Tax=Flavobacterium ichthyis TaxID=2698827 RepID=A0ABW9ZAK8_9FLAO|nr:hypothetical protein [Flavobacterium ichthyis]NBL64125.1 hypothetical protein [Flavobacterium ichthyis]